MHSGNYPKIQTRMLLRHQPYDLGRPYEEVSHLSSSLLSYSPFP